MNTNTNLITYFELHLFELKYNFFLFFFTFIYLFLINFYFSNQLIFLITKIINKSIILKYFIFTNITDLLLIKISLTLIFSLYYSCYFLIIQFLFFIVNALYKIENYKIIKLFIFYNCYNILFNFFLLIYIIPNIWLFFFNLNITQTFLVTFYFEPKIIDYLIFFIKTYFYFYIIFIYIIILFYFIKRYFKIKTLINLRKFFYLKFIIISIIISPPDFFNQILISLILIINFELYIFYNLYINFFK